MICGLLLRWNHNPEPFVSYYNVYRDYGEGFPPDSSNHVYSTIDTFYSDSQWRWIPDLCYKVAAVASNGLEGSYALLTGDSICDCDPLCGDEVEATPPAYHLAQNFPNPFNPTTSIRFDLPHAVYAILSIYNVKGELVATIVDRHMTAGRKDVTWNAKDNRGKPVASGIYFYRLSAGDFVQTRKMVLLR
jgi:hypothetical protein